MAILLEIVIVIRTEKGDLIFIKIVTFAVHYRSRSSMDRISDSGSDDVGSIPAGITKQFRARVSSNSEILL